MKLSARNILKGTVSNITKGAVAAEVEVDIGGGNMITSTITVKSVERLGLEAGKSVSVVIKASEVILGVE
jgi:molybdopterin-binding protein